MDKEKALGAAKIGLWMGGIMLGIFLAAHLIGRPVILIGNATTPPWDFLEFVRGVLVCVGFAVACAVASYWYQIAEDRRSKTKL
jgi:hypothetical protein